jgi:hypothetical protein
LKEVGWAPEPVWMWYRREKPYFCRKPNPGRPTLSLVTILTELFLLPTKKNEECMKERKKEDKNRKVMPGKEIIQEKKEELIRL